MVQDRPSSERESSHERLSVDRRLASRSRSRSPRTSRKRNHSRSRSPFGRRRARDSDREAPPQSRVLGIFGMSLYTTERDLERIFEEFGSIEKVSLVMDHPRGRSRGFGFVYFSRAEDAVKAKEYATDTAMEIDGHKVRVDYSLTKRAHTPTPGQYMGAPHQRSRRSPPPRERRRYSPRGYDRRDDHYRRRSPSPRDRYRYEDRYDRRPREYSPPPRRRSPSPRYRYDDRYDRRY
uniref:RRM domain-containing protein n=1 Tax=Acrobeloides nanus TaxID=290746 RepID=A0A914DA40_9BILA